MVERGALTPEQVQEVLAAQSKEGGLFGGVATWLGLIDQETLLDCLSEHFDIPFIDLSETGLIDRELARTLPEEDARRHGSLLVHARGDVRFGEVPAGSRGCVIGGLELGFGRAVSVRIPALHRGCEWGEVGVGQASGWSVA